MSMAKTAKTLNANVETKAYDAFYDISQEAELSVTNVIERIGYLIAAMNTKQRKDFITSLFVVKEPVN